MKTLKQMLKENPKARAYLIWTLLDRCLTVPAIFIGGYLMAVINIVPKASLAPYDSYAVLFTILAVCWFISTMMHTKAKRKWSVELDAEMRT